MIVAYRCECKNPDETHQRLLGIIEADNCFDAALSIISDIETEKQYTLVDFYESIYCIVWGETEETGYNESDIVDSWIKRIAFERGIINEEGVLL